ncbi:MAG: (d)CMP kinase, partial [Gammaproteobacteria bacterium]|nr:(d)CMP kinase [Gammaproteobacteria bacterium]
MNDIPVLTIDGPSGSGKGTVSVQVARKLGWHMLDSGALYRLVALGAERNGIALDNEAKLAEYATNLDVRFDLGDFEPVTLLEGKPVGDAIRSETCGNAASKVAALGLVRSALFQRQRDFRVAP